MTATLVVEVLHPLTHQKLTEESIFPSTRQAFETAGNILHTNTPTKEVILGELVGLKVRSNRGRDSRGNLQPETKLL